ncbi:MAG: hypothetical protein IT379_24985 [Deltaproteobacteria bacterium]|nr:hypothetical protein [Deltaproteobacteria bacterium]
MTDSVSGIAVVRFVSDPNDIGRSGIRITRYDDTTLAAFDATEIPTPFGLEPRSIALLESSNGPGVAFIEPGASREVDNLYVVPPSDAQSCASVAVVPTAGLDAAVELPIAATWTGDAPIVTLVTVEGTLRIYRTGVCHIRRNDSE